MNSAGGPVSKPPVGNSPEMGPFDRGKSSPRMPLIQVEGILGNLPRRLDTHVPSSYGPSGDSNVHFFGWFCCIIQGGRKCHLFIGGVLPRIFSDQKMYSNKNLLPVVW